MPYVMVDIESDGPITRWSAWERLLSNNGFNWQFINWYFHHFIGENPFGFSSTNLGSLYSGMQKDTFFSFKHLRKTKHTHNPVDDARGNAEALLQMKGMGLKIGFS